VDVLLIHEATMDDERADDAAAKKHSTVGGALSVGRRIAAGLRGVEARLRHLDARSVGRSASSGASGTASEGLRGASDVQLRLAGCILTHFSQRYPKLPPQATAAPAATATRAHGPAGTSSIVAVSGLPAGSGGRKTAAASSTTGVGVKRQRAHDAASTADSSTSGESKALKATEDGLLDDTLFDEVANRCLFAFDAMVIPLVPAPPRQPLPAPASTAAGADKSSGGSRCYGSEPIMGACDGRTEWPVFDAASDIQARIRAALAPDEDAAP
jgi:hypothetical protein